MDDHSNPRIHCAHELETLSKHISVFYINVNKSHQTYFLLIISMDLSV